MNERLEEIKMKSNNTTEPMLYVPYSDFNWLIEQAERVRELEEDLLELVKQNKELRKSIAFYSSESYNAHLERLLDRSEQQNKRYREALKKIIKEGENGEYSHYTAQRALEEKTDEQGTVREDKGKSQLSRSLR